MYTIYLLECESDSVEKLNVKFGGSDVCLVKGLYPSISNLKYQKFNYKY
jgi:hypothetical protein